MDAGEIGRRLGVKTATVHKWRLRYQTFPEPDTTLDIGPVWYWPTVLDWARNNERVQAGDEGIEIASLT